MSPNTNSGMNWYKEKWTAAKIAAESTSPGSDPRRSLSPENKTPRNKASSAMGAMTTAMRTVAATPTGVNGKSWVTSGVAGALIPTACVAAAYQMLNPRPAKAMPTALRTP